MRLMTTTPITHRRTERGFTLLELLVVVAILAIVGGGVVAAYDGLESKAAKGTATNTIMNLDKTLRTFRVLNNGEYPSSFDSLMEAQTTGAESLSASFDGTTGNPLVSMPSKLRGKLGAYALTQDMVDALVSVGITDARYIGSSLVDGSGITGNTSAGGIPVRAFDNTPRGRGLDRVFQNGDQVAVVESLGVADFTGSDPGHSQRLRDIAGLDETIQHIVVAMGVGNNCSMVKARGTGAGLAEAPFYTDVGKNEYSRYLALFHLASDDGADGAATPGDGVIEASEVLGSASLLAVLDTKGDWYDEEFAEYTGQKN